MNKKLIFALTIGVVIGVFGLIAYRLLTFKDPRVHYHANFAVYINGQKEAFDDQSYYEETSICDSNEKDNPKSRVHLHDQKAEVIHVHDKGAAWGHLFSNLRYGLSNKLLQTQKAVYIDGQDGKKLQFMLNGKVVGVIANQPIESKDVLLIAYGTESETELKTMYDKIVKNADEYNKSKDPSSCKGAKALNVLDKIKDILGIEHIE